jgi:hypothetical protein
MSQIQQELAADKDMLGLLAEAGDSLGVVVRAKRKRGSRKRRRNVKQERIASRPDRDDSLDIERLKAELRIAVAQKKARQPSSALLAAASRKSRRPELPLAHQADADIPEPARAEENKNCQTKAREQICPVDWLAIDASLKRVRQHVEIGAGLPELARLAGPLRPLARLAAGVILFATRFLTNRQSAFNIAGLTALHQLAEGIRRMHLSYNDQIQRLEKQLMLLRQEQSRKTGQ